MALHLCPLKGSRGRRACDTDERSNAIKVLQVFSLFYTFFMTTIDQLPIDILLDHVLPRLDVADLAQVSAACQLFYRLANDELIWQHRVTTDFALPMNTDRLKRGWKRLYIQFDRAQAYTWGENSDKRLGFSDQDHAERDT